VSSQPAHHAGRNLSPQLRPGAIGGAVGSPMMGREIKAFCQGQIAHYKIPRHIRFVEAFPMTVTGKIQKFVMRAVMINELGLEETKTA
jgi:fatty-acyl-CoA synthase